MAVLPQFFVRLRWKLMAGYTALTFLAVFVVFGILSLMNAHHIVYQSSFLGSSFVPDLQRASSIIEGVLLDEPDRATIEERLREHVETERNARELEVMLRPVSADLIAVIDEKGRVMATYPPGAIGTGESIRAHLAAEGDIVVNNMLLEQRTGEGRRHPETGEYFAAARFERGRNGGGLVLRYRPNFADVIRLARGFNLPLLPVFLFSLVSGGLCGFVASSWITRRLGRFFTPAEAWSRADFSVLVDDHSRDELGQLARNLNGMAGRLQDHFQTRADLAALGERNRVARDLHDSVKQQIFAASLQVAAARECIERGTGGELEPLRRAEAMTQDAGRELSRLIRELRPAELEGKGLMAALRDYGARWSKETGITLEVRAQGERETSVLVEQELFRVAQEALNNVARHSRATGAEILVVWGDGIRLTVSDDGVGMTGAEPRGSGIKNMRERIEALGGMLRVESPSRGTRISVECSAGAGLGRSAGTGSGAGAGGER